MFDKQNSNFSNVPHPAEQPGISRAKSLGRRPRKDIFAPRDRGFNSNGARDEIVAGSTEIVAGVLDDTYQGHGLIKPKYSPSERDTYISSSQIMRFNLRSGDWVEGPARAPKPNERYWGLLKVEKVNGLDPEENAQDRPVFEDLLPIYPREKLKMEFEGGAVSNRIIDLITPIGRGQRALIVSPPKAGKTTILKNILTGLAKNYPKLHLMAVLVGERPEEVTDFVMHMNDIVGDKEMPYGGIRGEVVASNFDQREQEQTEIAELALDRARRLAEQGVDVVILLDSITRLGRAYNLSVRGHGKTMSGGFDSEALFPVKKFFGAARNFKDGGSLTIIGTALIDTGSRMDDLIYEEFKGTGNSELTLSRMLSEKRIFPAINILRSSTRKEELLLGEEELRKVTKMRRMINMLDDEEQTMVFMERLKKTKDNKEFLDKIDQGV